MTREISDIIIALAGAAMLFIAMPWLFLHYASRLRRQEEINEVNQRLIEDLTERARRLDERAATLERIADVDSPASRSVGAVDPKQPLRDMSEAPDTGRKE